MFHLVFIIDSCQVKLFREGIARKNLYYPMDLVQELRLATPSKLLD
jgi:hypothetical protein